MPRVCVVCGRQLGPDESLVCKTCAEDVPQTYHYLQARNPMADRFNAIISSYENEKGIEDGRKTEKYCYACALFFYNPESGYSNITKSLKYRSDFRTGRLFAEELGRKLRSASYMSDVDLVVPVPLHWTRKWHRGHNQAETIAGSVAAVLGVSLETGLLVRRKVTRSQVLMDRSGRAGNLRGAFEVRESALRRIQAECPPRHILIVDDVFTTGSTVFECYRALRKAIGYDSRISVATLAFA